MFVCLIITLTFQNKGYFIGIYHYLRFNIGKNAKNVIMFEHGIKFLFPKGVKYRQVLCKTELKSSIINGHTMEFISLHFPQKKPI